MHTGEFEGKQAKAQPVRVLILGESHYWSEDKSEEEKKTSKVMDTYLSETYSYRFFDNIVRSFGVAPEKRKDFWEKVWFGNYIDEPCGIRDSQADNLLKQPGKREELNRQRFSFIEKNKIDVVFCFSRRVYDKLPPLEEALGDSEKKGEERDTHRMNVCIYEAGNREKVSVALSKKVVVYGLKHPSQGFSYRRYREILKRNLKKLQQK